MGRRRDRLRGRLVMTTGTSGNSESAPSKPGLNFGTVLIALGLVAWVGSMLSVPMSAIFGGRETYNWSILVAVHLGSYPIVGLGAWLDARISGSTIRQSVRRALSAIFEMITFP